MMDRPFVSKQVLPHKELTDRIIAAAIKVHRALGPGFLEAIYEEAFAAELKFQGINFDRQMPVKIRYRDVEIGEHRLDFLVESTAVVELKAIQELEKIHFSIVRSYLKVTDKQIGLLMNFATMPLTIKRVGREESARDPFIS
jgi:GxxExxY protein